MIEEWQLPLRLDIDWFISISYWWYWSMISWLTTYMERERDRPTNRQTDYLISLWKCRIRCQRIATCIIGIISVVVGWCRWERFTWWWRKSRIPGVSLLGPWSVEKLSYLLNYLLFLLSNFHPRQLFFCSRINIVFHLSCRVCQEVLVNLEKPERLVKRARRGLRDLWGQQDRLWVDFFLRFCLAVFVLGVCDLLNSLSYSMNYRCYFNFAMAWRLFNDKFCMSLFLASGVWINESIHS